jgi:small multidrug resistance family-3 protein
MPHGSIYIGVGGWQGFVEGQRPDRWDVIGSSVAVIGAAIIIFGARR